MRGRLNTLGALRAVVEGRKVPPCKWAALQRLSFIVVRGHGRERGPRLTDAGREALAEAEARA